MLGVGVGFDTRGKGTMTIKDPVEAGDVHTIEDSREGWTEALRRLLDAFNHDDTLPDDWDYSEIRPKGAPIESFGGTASGPEPLKEMLETLEELYRSYIGQEVDARLIVDTMNIAGKCVVSGGVRRTAQIALGEPDDDQFLDLKQDDEKVREYRWASNNSIFAEIGMDYSDVAERTADNGEPGYVWLENMRKFGRTKDDPTWDDSDVMGFNPCVTKDSIVMTRRGPRKVESLIGEPFEAAVNSDFFESDGFFNTGKKEVYRLKTQDGHTIKATPDHKIRVCTERTQKKRHGDWVELGKLEEGDEVILNNNRDISEWEGPGTFEQGWLIGELLGDGYINDGQAILEFGGDNKEEMLKAAKKRVRKLGGDSRSHKMRDYELEERDKWGLSSKKLYELAGEFGVEDDKSLDTERLLFTSSDFQRGFVRGLFDADGTVEGDHKKGCSVRLWSTRKEYCRILQKMLLNLGMNSSIHNDRMNRDTSELPDGKGGYKEYDVKEADELVVSNDNLVLFEDRIGFEERDKLHDLRQLISSYERQPNRERFVSKVSEVQKIGKREVYDCNVEDVHRFSCNGVIVHNCVEQPLEDRELCTLVETFPAHHESFEDFRKTLKVAYLYAKTVTLIPTHDESTNQVMLKNRRIGCSMSGIVQAIEKRGLREHLRWCDEGYQYIQNIDRIYSDWLGVPESIKTTSVKPSGTVSQLSGSTPGVHFEHSPYFIRRVRVQNTSPIWEAAQEAGYPVEDDAYSDDTKVIEFALRPDHLQRSKDEVSIWEMVKLAALHQKWWSDNGVSATVQFDESEKGEIPYVLEAFERELKGISFLQKEDHGYEQAPYEEITQEEYLQRRESVDMIDFSDTTHEQDDKFCGSDKCSVDLGDDDDQEQSQ
jgi:intein/homing endonuclease